MIAFEGWEYHKLPSENLEDYRSSQVKNNSRPLTATFPGKTNQPEMKPIQRNKKGDHLLDPAE
jgi:hypothetical protein